MKLFKINHPQILLRIIMNISHLWLWIPSSFTISQLVSSGQKQPLPYSAWSQHLLTCIPIHPPYAYSSLTSHIAVWFLISQSYTLPWISTHLLGFPLPPNNKIVSPLDSSMQKVVTGLLNTKEPMWLMITGLLSKVGPMWADNWDHTQCPEWQIILS